jgi:co-chaperonin GroES (HSP10)
VRGTSTREAKAISKHYHQFITGGETSMAKLVPLGARVLVKDEIPIDDVTARMEKAGLFSAVYDHNKPFPTTGIVVAVGSDPEVQRLIAVGDKVFFGKHCGIITRVDGEEYRSLEFHEISSVVKED